MVIGIPRLLIDIRHEGSHRGLPALQLLRSASVKALDWLKSYYWEPQSKAIPFERDGNAKVRKKIKSKLRELSFCLKATRFPSLIVQYSRENVLRNKFLRYRNLLFSYYSSYSSEIVGVLLEYLLEALSSSELVEHTEQVSCPTINIILADWKVVILRFCDKEPELLLNLFKEVLIMMRPRNK
ncbi:protein LAS1-like [Prosopis cineraria]|uniref:protein LAS1-like n=1 Tax=Prosopis cineraria TaxID=364024 RepID=UPI00240F1D6E|nr:protein LAS1-like [Prosopis cineraria]